MEVVDADDLIVITDKGVLMRQPVSHIRTIGRVTQGVKLVKLDEGTKISSISRVINDENPETEPTQTEKTDDVALVEEEPKPTDEPKEQV